MTPAPSDAHAARYALMQAIVGGRSIEIPCSLSSFKRHFPRQGVRNKSATPFAPSA